MTSVTDEDYDPDEHEPLPEGEEAPPPLVHTMAIVRWVLFAGMSVFALAMVLGYFGLNPLAGATETASQYNCPMHPTYVSNQPGDCPICGMSLVPIKGDGKQATSAEREGRAAETMSLAKPGQFTCPMHPEVVSDTAGRCPECNMFLEQVPATTKSYTCPMHPEVVSDKPGDCPKCGMDLVEVKQTAAEPADQDMRMMGQAPVPGLVSITIEDQRLQLIGLKTATAARRNLDEGRRFVGFVTPDETKLANLQVRVSGWVKTLFANQTGQLVEKGEPLLSIYSQGLYEAERDFLVTRDAAAQSGTDTLLAGMHKQLLEGSRERLRLLGLSDQEIASVEAADIPSQELAIRSPFRGYVIEKSVVAGQYVTPDQPLLSIADLSRIWVLVDVYEQDAGSIQIGQRATVRATAYPGRDFDGKIGFVYPQVSAQTRTLKARVELDNPDLILRPGMYAEVDFEGSTNSTLVVPADAVMDGGETKYVFAVQRGNHFEPRLVTTGRSSNDWIEILAGLTEGETVVTSANFLIDSESRLKAAISGMGRTQPGAHEDHGTQ